MPEGLADFIALPRGIYAGERRYIPPLDLERRDLLDPRRAPFFRHGKAAFWIAYRDGVAVGRVSAQTDDLAKGDLARIGFFGAFDCIDDREVAAALLRTAEAWLAQAGKTQIRGPFLLSINGESGLLIKGFDEPPMIQMPWHPPYLKGLLERRGYSLVKILHSYDLDLGDPALRERLEKLSARRRPDFDIKPFARGSLMGQAERARVLFNQSWADNWGFIPVSPEEMATLIKRMKPLLKSDYGVFIEQKGKLVGFAIFVPNLFEATADLGARPSVPGWARLAWRIVRHRFTGGRLVLFGLSRSLVGSVSGAAVALLLVDELVRRAGNSHVRHVECGWILDDNYAMTSVVQWLGARPTRQFGVFQADLPQSKPGAEDEADVIWS